MNEQPPRGQFREGFQENPTNGQPQDAAAQPQELPQPEEQRREQWPITVKLLHKPVRNNAGNFVHELTFREPTGGDINRYGNPTRIDAQGDVIIDERKMTTIMAVLSGVLQPFLEGMDPRDWNSCAYRLRNFFLPDPAAW